MIVPTRQPRIREVREPTGLGKHRHDSLRRHEFFSTAVSFPARRSRNGTLKAERITARRRAVAGSRLKGTDGPRRVGDCGTTAENGDLRSCCSHSDCPVVLSRVLCK